MRRAFEESFDVLRPLDRGPPVRMHGDTETARVRDLRDTIDAVEQSPPGIVRELRRGGIAGLRERRREDDELGPARGEPFRLALHRSELLRSASVLVKDRRDEAADEPKLI